MYTFLACQNVMAYSPQVKIVVNILKSIPIDARIYQRGIREQRNALLLSHYYPDSKKRQIYSHPNNIHFIKKDISGAVK